MFFAKCELAICKLHKAILLSDLEITLDVIGSSFDWSGCDF
jgi:hypothetical protein